MSQRQMQSSVRQLAPRTVDSQPGDGLGPKTISKIVPFPPKPAFHEPQYTVLSDEDLKLMLNTSSARLRRQRGPERAGENGPLQHHPLRLKASRRELARLERDRQSMRELATFLRTREPPPTNLMSMPDDEEAVLKCSSKLPLQMFRRHQQRKKKASLATRPLRLPDSAVAAKTTKGHWHIAISIPLAAFGGEDANQDATEGVSPRPNLAPSQLSTANIQPRPQKSMPLLTTGEKLAGEDVATSIERRRSLRTNLSATSDMIDADAAATLRNFYRQEALHEKPLSCSEAPESTRKAEKVKGKPTFVPVFPSQLDRHASQGTDPRHSGGTTYSQNTAETHANHSRGPGSASANPSLATFGRQVEPPVRCSSRLKTGGQAIIEPPSPTSAEPTSAISEKPSESQPPRNSGESGKSFQFAFSSISSGGTAHRHGHSDSLTSVRSAPLTPAPTRALPDLPEASIDGGSCRSRSRSDLTNTNSGAKLSSHAAKDDPIQRRQAKVKALRMRDVNAAKAGRKSKDDDNQSTTTQENIKGKAAVRDAVSRNRRTSLRPDSAIAATASRRNVKDNSLSPIMLVADEEPWIPRTSPSDFPMPSTFVPPSGSRRARTLARKTLTPPRSLTPSLASSDEEGPHQPRPNGPSGSATGSLRSKPQHSRHQSAASLQRSSKTSSRNSYDDDVKLRLQKLEQSNAMILQTLSAVMQMGNSIKELNQILLAESAGRRAAPLAPPTAPDTAQRRLSAHKIYPMPEDGGLEAVEPLMSEMRETSRVSQELDRDYYNDFDAEQGYQLLF